MVLDAESVIDRRRLKRRLTAWRIAAVALGLLLLGALLLITSRRLLLVDASGSMLDIRLVFA
jgi:hypothetical protein